MGAVAHPSAKIHINIKHLIKRLCEKGILAINTKFIYSI